MRPSVPGIPKFMYPMMYALYPMMTACLQGKQSGQPGGDIIQRGLYPCLRGKQSGQPGYTSYQMGLYSCQEGKELDSRLSKSSE